MTTSASVPASSFTAYRVSASPARLRSGERGRAWMDAHAGKHPYKCLPMPAANEFGWDLYLPFAVEVTWNGGIRGEDLTVRSLDPKRAAEPWVVSNFNHGIVTFDTGYLFRTPPGWCLLVQGPPNAPKDGAAPLSGLVETDWVPYTFTMNWQLTRPGTVVFAADEPFCRLVPVQVEPVRTMQPVIRSVADDPELLAGLRAYNDRRKELRLAADAGEARTDTHGYYAKGHLPGGACPARHLTRYDVPVPVELETASAEPLFRGLCGHTPTEAKIEAPEAREDPPAARILTTEEPLLTADECRHLVAAIETHSAKLRKDGEDAYGHRQSFFDGRLLRAADVMDDDPVAARIVAEAHGVIVGIVEEAFGIGPLGADDVHLVIWPKGSSMPEHMDNCHPNPGEAHRTPWREIAAVVYLNDDYEGGHTVFPKHGVTVAPRRGYLTAFPADRSHPHAVGKVGKGVRYTLAMWLTRDRTRWAGAISAPDPSRKPDAVRGAAEVAR